MDLTGIIVIDVHGMRTEEALDAIQKKVNLNIFLFIIKNFIIMDLF